MGGLFERLRGLVSGGLVSSGLVSGRPDEGPLAGLRAELPAASTPWAEARYLAIDVETTGLDPRTDEIVSFGFVPIDGGVLRLAEAGHLLVRPGKPMPDASARLHGLLDDRLQAAPPLAEVMPAVLDALRGRIPIAHNARAEKGFLDAACMRLYGQALRLPFVDTLALEIRLLGGGETRPIGRGEIRLAACRARHNLPRYKLHDALADALAAGELFLAQASRLGGTVKNLVSR